MWPGRMPVLRQHHIGGSAGDSALIGSMISSPPATARLPPGRKSYWMSTTISDVVGTKAGRHSRAYMARRSREWWPARSDRVDARQDREACRSKRELRFLRPRRRPPVGDHRRRRSALTLSTASWVKPASSMRPARASSISAVPPSMIAAAPGALFLVGRRFGRRIAEKATISAVPHQRCMVDLVGHGLGEGAGGEQHGAARRRQ